MSKNGKIEIERSEGSYSTPSLKSLVGPLKCEIGHVSYMDKSAHDCASIEYVLFVILRRFKGL